MLKTDYFNSLICAFLLHKELLRIRHKKIFIYYTPTLFILLGANLFFNILKLKLKLSHFLYVYYFSKSFSLFIQNKMKTVLF